MRGERSESSAEARGTLRGAAQIRAAARDDQETAQRNGFKPGWRRARLWELIEKLQEEYLEFLKAIEEADREGMRWEGSDLRWCVTMLQDHHGVLELNEATRPRSDEKEGEDG